LAQKIVEELEADEKVRKRLAKLLVPEAVSEPDLRLAIINAVLRDVATKDDVVKLREEIEKIRIATKEDINRLEERIEVFRKEIYAQVAELRERVSKLEGAFTQLVERIGDLDKRIDALDKRIDALDKRIDSLDKRIDALDKRIDYVTKVSWALTLSVLATLIAQIMMRILLR
jgi:predicted nuclease with TOPRIM domain